MPDPDLPRLTQADPETLHFALRHALMFNRKKRIDTAREMMADRMDAHLIEALRLSGYVVMERPAPDAPPAGVSPEYEADLRARKHLTE